jgi:hypothetical protein
VRLHSTAAILDETRDQVDRLDQRVGGGATGRIGLGARIGDDQRHLDRAVVEEVLFAQPMIAEIVAVIAGEDDHRVAG